ncbi:PIN domain-containing protein [Candidatus Woesearchaeota archaeon]|nr:PIN domain-containing protein [Candidatus Woesearchaeota archaeon]
MKFIDSNVLIYAFTNNSKSEECINIIHNEQCVINTLVLVEVYTKLRVIVNQQYARNVTKSLFKKDNLLIVNLDIFLFFEALKRQQKYNQLEIFDLIHYTTALLYNCSSIVSNDGDFDNLEIPREQL